jgi:predicted oxidoreductase
VRGWLVERSVRFFPIVHWVERGMADTPGNSLPRFHMVWGTGEGLVRTLRGHLESHPRRSRLQLCFGHRVEGLVRSAGRVAGAAGVRSDGAAFSAEGSAVIVAAGGIAGDLGLVRRHWNKRWGEPPDYLLNGSHPAADGKMHAAVEALGGRVTHLENLWSYAAGVHHWQPAHPLHGLSLVPPKSALWVNWQGRRLGPPSLVTSFDTLYLVESICKQAKKYSWQILNWRIAKKELAVSGAQFNHAVRNRKPIQFLRHLLLGNPRLVRDFIEHCPDFVTADSVPELVGKMNALTGAEDVDAGVLSEEIRAYDAAIARGPRYYNDDQLLRIAQARRYRGDRVRTCKFAPIDDAAARPLIAIREFILTRKSLGGIQTDLESRVLDGAGQPLPGLYAAGEAAGFGGGGVHGRRSLEGTFLGGCILTGRVAAQSIAAAR